MILFGLVEYGFGCLITILHLLLCLVMAYGVLFSKTLIQAYSVLCCLVVMFLMIRQFKCCILTPMELSGPTQTSRLGRALMVKDSEKVDLTTFEEISVGTVTVLQLIRTLTILIRSPEVLF